jgi:hypothetical protein
MHLTRFFIKILRMIFFHNIKVVNTDPNKKKIVHFIRFTLSFDL